MDLAELRRHWDMFGKTDPLWAILTDPTRKGNKWDLVEFFRTGEVDVDAAVAKVESLGIQLGKRRALDFGCGVGRLTQALARHFRESCGVDIASSMIELANEYNRYPDRVRYFVSTANDLRLFDDASFDFVLTIIVLQHMEERFARNYIREFLRVLMPGGVAVFQVPSHTTPPQPSKRLSRSAFRAAIRFLEAPPPSAASRSRFRIRVEVTNASAVPWACGGSATGELQVSLGNHWLDETGKVLVLDDARASLPAVLGPGQGVQLELLVSCPANPGHYGLELDMVQEGFRWFQEMGSATLLHTIDIVAEGAPARPVEALPAASPSPPVAEDEPKMEMHCVRKSDVIHLVRASGGRVVEVERDNACGPLWESYRYYVQKKAAGSSPKRLLSQLIQKLVG